jgi:proteasome alpha subunit
VFTPYDWQEGIGNRAQYIEGKLAQGMPVLAASIDGGIVVFTYRRQVPKIYEVYDRLAFAAIGQQADVEALRMAAVDFASQEGYHRSEQDVTIQRLVNALSSPLKKAFGDFGVAPVVARSLFAEVDASPDGDLYYILDYDGDFSVTRRFALLLGGEAPDEVKSRLQSFAPNRAPEAAVEELRDLWRLARGDEPLPEDLEPDAVLLERSEERENRFRRL